MSFPSEFRSKMEAEGLKKEFVDGWVGLYEKLCAGDKGMIPEGTIEPVTSLPELETLPEGDKNLLGKTVLLKLNGGLGTGMGLEKAKSLLELKDGNTFLDLIAQQVIKLRREGLPIKFMLMNSFSTEQDTREFFEKYPEIAKEWDQVSFMQNKSPKVDAETMRPISWPQKPSCEWCPPGHGDIYAALVCSGKLDQLLASGYEYAFVSNSDNLGATLDLRLLGRLAAGGAPMLMEVCVRGEDDKKGGHLCRDITTGKLTLRESAQCPESDEKAFQDINKHRFFNTNNLWLNLRKLKEAMVGGVLPLPLIVNEKKVDPSSKEKPNPKVYQLETAMGAAIASLPGSEAVIVPFDRFAPVKTCNQLFGLRSDAYVISEDFKPVLSPGSFKPVIKFDDNYKMVPDMEEACVNGVPSLAACPKLTVKGKVLFLPGSVVQGETSIVNEGEERAVVGGYLTGDVNATGCTAENPAGQIRVTVPPELFERILRGEAVSEEEIKQHAPVAPPASKADDGDGEGKKKKKSKKVKVSKKKKGCC
jgi:UDP-N-acetylglucosamine pyrophosphorylase